MVESTDGRVAVIKDQQPADHAVHPPLRESFGQHILDVTLEAIRRKWNNSSTSSSATSSRTPSRSSSRNNSGNNSSEEDSDDENNSAPSLKPRPCAIEGGVVVNGEEKDQAHQEHRVMLEGSMRKLGGMLGTWHERYFVLKGDERQILYYKKKRHFLEKRRPRGMIDLHGAFAKRKNDDEDREHVFVIFHPEEMDSIFYLQASCEQQVTQWVSAVNHLTEEEEREREEQEQEHMEHTEHTL